ncbi:hypothetical protein [Pseudophaeobacter sp.]|uniref:hypothetical protein n=1 Tax=Pseudophaeobacter sp. TaxID=1971739 RepID=UPI00261355A4|nr:hypothetical protein [Pseudophaeobacter sp.]
MTDHPKSLMASRILRGATSTCFGLVSGLAVLGIILWDADFYTARDKFEHLKIALFGKWSADNWCPAGRTSTNCAAADDFEAALEDASDFTFFKSAGIADSELTIQTGIRFATARDVVSGKPSSQWCYVSVPSGGISQQIELATKSADEPPVYAEFTSLDASAVAMAGLSVDSSRPLSLPL